MRKKKIISKKKQMNFGTTAAKSSFLAVDDKNGLYIFGRVEPYVGQEHQRISDKSGVAVLKISNMDLGGVPVLADLGSDFGVVVTSNKTVTFFDPRTLRDIEELRGLSIISVTCGSRLCACLSADGTVYYSKVSIFKKKPYLSFGLTGFLEECSVTFDLLLYLWCKIIHNLINHHAAFQQPLRKAWNQGQDDLCQI